MPAGLLSLGCRRSCVSAVIRRVGALLRWRFVVWIEYGVVFIFQIQTKAVPNPMHGPGLLPTCMHVHPRRAVQGAAAVQGVQATNEPRVENPQGVAWMYPVGTVKSWTADRLAQHSSSTYE
jgi:hypothetical protein